MSSETTQRPPVLGDVSAHSYTLRELLLYFLRLGTFGFGGPIALAGHMQKDLVEDRRWVSKPDYLEGLAFSQLSPGPLAAQLAMYIGWLRAGTIGATLVGVAFILPSFLMVLVLAALYVHYGSLPWIQGMFYGIGAAVIAIIVRSAIKLVRTTVGKDWLLWTVFCRSGDHHSLDEIRNYLAFYPMRLYRDVGQGSAWSAPTSDTPDVSWWLKSTSCRDPRRSCCQYCNSPLSFFLEGRGLRLRQRIGHCSFLVRRSRREVSLAH